MNTHLVPVSGIQTKQTSMSEIAVIDLVQVSGGATATVKSGGSTATGSGHSVTGGGNNGMVVIHAED